MSAITNHSISTHYYTTILIATFILTFLMLGWLFFYKDYTKEEVVETYDNFLIALEKNNIENAWYNWDILLSKFRKSIYAALAAMHMAKIAVDANSYELAIQQLELVVSNTNFQELKEIARLRIAKLLIAQGNIRGAEAQLHYIDNTNFTAEYKEIMGDIAITNGDYIKANIAFNNAIATLKEFGTLPLPLMLKANDLLSQE